MSSQQITDELYEIIDELIEKSRRNQPEPSQSKEKNDEQDNSRSEKPQSDNTKSQQSKEDKTIKLSNLSYKELASTKKDLNNLKEQLVNIKNPRQFKNQLSKINKLENKIDHALEKRPEKDIQKSIHSLQKNPRYYVLQVINTKEKLEKIKFNLEKNPRQNQKQLEKINHIEKRLDQKINRMKSNQLNITIHLIQKNPKKYKQELTKFKIIDRKLEKQQKLKAQEKNIQKENKKPTNKEVALAR